MKSDLLMKRLVQGSAAVTVLLLGQSLLGFLTMPGAAGWPQALIYTRADQFVLVGLFTVLLARTAGAWRTGSDKGLMMVQIYAALLLIYCFQHINLYRAEGLLMNLSFAAAMGALALLAMVTYYVKYRESRR